MDKADEHAKGRSFDVDRACPGPPGAGSVPVRKAGAVGSRTQAKHAAAYLGGKPAQPTPT